MVSHLKKKYNEMVILQFTVWLVWKGCHKKKGSSIFQILSSKQQIIYEEDGQYSQGFHDY